MPLKDEDQRQLIKKALVSQKRPTVTVLSSLLAVQDVLGYLPDEAVKQVAQHTNSTINEVWGVATFYTNFRFAPLAEHVVELCWGPSCHVVGAPDIMARVVDMLGLEGEGDTSDGKITLGYNTCLGACAQAPVISIDHHLHGRMTPESAANAIKGL